MLQSRFCLFGKRIVKIAVVSAFLFACAQSKEQPEPLENLEPAPPPTIEHTVKYPGETLGLISRWYTGKSSNWEQILSANPGLDPRRINLGNVILIPTDLLVKDGPMPKEFVGSVASETKESAKQVGSAVMGSSTDGMKVEASGDGSAESQDAAVSEGEELSEKEQLRRDLEAALAAEVQDDESLPVEETKEGQLEEASVDPSADDIDRDRLLDELLSE